MPAVNTKISPSVNAATRDSSDSVAAKPAYAPKYLKAFPDSSGNNLEIVNPADASVLVEPRGAVAAEPRATSPLHDNWTMLLVLSVVFLITVSYRKGYKYVADFFHNITSVREHQNMFEDHTVKETQIMTALTANTCIFEGIILFEAFIFLHPGTIGTEMPVFKFIGALAAFAAAFHLLQLGLCYLLGFIFSDKLSTKLWLDGFKAAQSMLGTVLAPVAFVMMLCPDCIKTCLFIAVFLYFTARIIIICKAFRIFFNNLQSLLYFILYLCSVEIVPVILSFAGAMNLCGILTGGLNE